MQYDEPVYFLPPATVNRAPCLFPGFFRLFPLLVGLHRRHYLLRLARSPRPSQAKWQNPQVPSKQDLRVKRFPFDFCLFPLGKFRYMGAYLG